MAHAENYQPRGYHRLAKLMGTYNEAAVFRRFGPLTMLSLLSLQADIVDIEGQLRDTVKYDDTFCDPKISSWSSDFYELRNTRVQQPRQRELVEQACAKLTHYHAMVTQFADVERLKRPSVNNITLLRDWLAGDEEGANFLKYREAKTWSKENDFDLVTLDLKDDHRSPFLQWLERRFIDLYHFVWGGRGDNRTVIDIESGRVLQYDNSRVVRGFLVICRSTGVLVASLLPVLAILALYFVEDTLKRIGITICLTTLFGFAMSLFTSATVKEVFGASAAFAAVEVVFIGTVT